MLDKSKALSKACQNIREGDKIMAFAFKQPNMKTPENCKLVLTEACVNCNRNVAIRVGNRAAVTKLWIKFEELKENPENVKMEEFKAIEYAVTQKKKIIHDLNEKMKEIQHEDHIEQEITDLDEYMLDLDSKLKQIRKLKQTIKSPNNNSNLKESKQ
ncbi:unnamed protein product [Mytilus edulis]|uniref:Uncharacterized protein n=1 Tax=Mytilus edulis TaxID=6550 RepID=A0A8S3UVF0_MYTED|nr:unnamed protein product [Mytilus edulis]